MKRIMMVALGVVALHLGAIGHVRADGPGVRNLFFISKSSNRNQVHYGIRLDAQCRPVGNAPVVAWWQMREEGDGVTEPLLDREQRVYGIRRQVVTRTDDGGSVVVRMRALEGRSIRIESWQDGEQCRARAVTVIDGVRSELRHVHAILRLLGIARVDIHGVRLADHEPIVERYDP